MCLYRMHVFLAVLGQLNKSSNFYSLGGLPPPLKVGLEASMLDWTGHWPGKKSLSLNFYFAPEWTFPGNVHSRTTQNHNSRDHMPAEIVKSWFRLYENSNSQEMLILVQPLRPMHENKNLQDLFILCPCGICPEWEIGMSMSRKYKVMSRK